MAKDIVESGMTIQSDPFGFGMTEEERFNVSAPKLAYDILGDSFFKMTKAQRDYVLELIRSGDLTASEIQQAAEYALPYDPELGRSEQELTYVAPGNHRLFLPEEAKSLRAKEMSEAEFYKTFFNYDYKETEIPQEIREIYAGLMGTSVENTPKTSDNLPRQRIESPTPDSEKRIAMATGGYTLPRLDIGAQPTLNMSGTPDYTSFFNPESISEQQYLTGGVDFYTQTLGTGIQSTVTDEDKSEEETKEDTGPNIFKPIGGDGGPEDVGKTALENALKGGANPLDNVTLYNEGQLNPSAISFDSMGNVSTNQYSKSFEVDPKTGKTTLKAKGDLVSDFFSNFTNNLQASSAQQVSNAFNMASAPTLMGPTGKPRAVGLPGAVSLGLSVVGLGLFSGLASIGGAANMSIQQQNAARIKAVGGGAFMDVNGMMVSRAPGSLMYSGNLQGMSQKQMQSLEAVRRGYLPGSLQLETFDPVTGRWGEATGKKAMFLMTGKEMAEQGGAYNPETGGWTNLDGSGAAQGTKEQAQALADKVNGMFKANVMNWTDVNTIRSSLKTDIFGNIQPGSLNFNDSYTKEAIDRASKATGLTADELTAVVKGEDFVVKGIGKTGGMNDQGYSTFSGFRGSSEDAPDTRDPMSKEVQAEIEKAMKEQTGSGKDDPAPSTPSGPSFDDDAVGRDSGKDNSSSSGSSADASDDGSGGTAFKSGGRVGYQAGGEAGFAERPEFVGGNQTQPDGVSVADDQPRDVQEGTFVINAAAADFAGRGDIEKMLRDAYKRVGDTGQSGVSQEVQIAVSKGEVIIPPHIAKEIGYDRLNKINNRGKKEIARRQEAAGGGFIDRKKYAKGDKVVPLSNPQRKKEALADVELRADLEEYMQEDNLARLGFNLYEKGLLDVNAIVLPKRAKEDIEVGTGGMYTPAVSSRNVQARRVATGDDREMMDAAQSQGVKLDMRKPSGGISYFVNEASNYSREDANLILIHELRHAALDYIANTYNIPEDKRLTISREEHLFDAQDYMNRKQARKVKPSIPETYAEPEKQQVSSSAASLASTRKQLQMYQDLAQKVLQDRKVPKRTKSKEVEGFVTRAMGLLGL